MTSSDQCALGKDGQLLDADKMDWYNDCNDATPLPPMGSSSVSAIHLSYGFLSH
jgi:hypothetical protein